MDKETINKFILILSAISLTAFAVGSYIINYSLSEFRIMDFDLVKPHAVIVGFVFLGFFIAHILVFFLFMDITDIGGNSLRRALLVTAVKVAFLTVVLTILFDFKAVFDPIYSLHVFSYKIDVVKFCFGFLLALPAALVISYEEIKSGKKDVLVYLWKATVLFGILSCLLLFLTFYNNPVFEHILYLELYGAGIFIGAIVFTPVKNSSEEPQKTTGSLFSKGPITKKYHFVVLSVFVVACFIPAFMAIMGFYTRIIYPHISQSFGGGKMEEITYITPGDTITGKKVHESSDAVFLLDKDSSIIRIEWKDVKQISSKVPPRPKPLKSIRHSSAGRHY